MIRRPPRSTPLYSSAASDVYKRQVYENESKRAVIEGDVPISESKLADYSDQIEMEHNKRMRQKRGDAQNDLMIIDVKKQGAEEALDKEYQLEERKIHLDNKNEVDRLAKERDKKRTELEEKFTKELKQAPTSKEKSDLLQRYEDTKNELERMFDEEKRKADSKMEAKLAERKREKEKKKLELEAEAQQQKVEVNRKANSDLYADAEKQSDDMIMKLLDQALRQGEISESEEGKQKPADVPIAFEYLVGRKTSQNVNALKKAQFADLSQQLSFMYSQLMKEKLLDTLANKEATKKKIKDLESKSLPVNKYQAKLERIQKDEVKTNEAISVNYENRLATQESRVRIALAEQHYEELLKIINNEEASRKRLLDRMLLRYNGNGLISKSVIDELNKKKAEEFDEMREEAKRERDRKIAEAQRMLGDMNQEDLKDIEKKYAKEIDQEAKELDEKLKKKKKKVLEERKKQYEERLSNIPAISIEQRKQLMEEYMNDMERLEGNMNAAREDQLKKLREKLINKKVQQERIRSRAEQKVIKKIRDMNKDQVVVDEKQKEQIETVKAKAKAEPKASPYNYMMLLKRWAQKVDEKKSQPTVTEVVEKEMVEEVKEGAQVGDADGAFVNMKELFETVLSCYDLAINVQNFEFPEIAKAIEKLTYFMEAVLKGGKRLAEASIGRLGPKPT
eukprot:TRINITY_DN1543_c0_g2_i3.p1 TRINITY_DN1543_c0_g2~~TRINITY_DN1543_c0_g2_i3.p1  ORF type:complete len:686 (-),score=367.48 TRINITY_DN1543_c0_g2_i3:58-2094(-)